MPHHKYSSAQALSRLIHFYRGDWSDIFTIIVYGVTSGLFALVVPLAAQSLVNTVAFGTLIQPLIVLTGAVILLLSFAGVFKVAQFIIAEKLAQRLMVRVGLDLARWIPELKYDVFKTSFGSEYINRFLEIATVQKSTTFILLDGSTVIFQLLFAVVFLGLYHPFFLLFSMVVSATLFVAIFIFGRSAIPTAILESDNKYNILACVEDMAAAPQLFKSSFGQRAAIKKMDGLIMSYLSARRSHFRVLLGQQVTMVSLQILGNATLLGIGGWLVIKQELSLGQLVAAELIFTAILSNTDKLTKLLETLYDLTAGVNKLELLAKLPKERMVGDCAAESSEPMILELKDVSYTHKGGESLFASVNLKVSAGEKIVIVGGNGVGKSVLADFITGAKMPSRGVMLLDGVSTADLNLNHVRSSIALVRGIEVIHGTIEENLKFAYESISTREIREVLDKVKLLDEIDALPEGLRTYFKGDYSPLSLGQAERLMIARALLQKPRLLILDASLDVIDEGSVLETIELITSDYCRSTVIAFTHERDFCAGFDAAYELKDGMLIAFSNCGVPHV